MTKRALAFSVATIMTAYELQQDAQLAGGPLDLLPAKYDITARVANTATIAMKELPQLLRTLLADRFKLKTHTETRELTGRYDFAMRLDLQMVLALAKRMGAPVPAAAANIPQSDGSSLMTALNEQLGLKLESVRAPVNVVVIDSVEAPTPD